jgi:predicted nucleic acid-binding protein
VYYFYFDASALVKRYTEEIGSDKVDFLFANVPLNHLMCLNFGAAEVFWICVRKRNDRRIAPREFAQAIGHLNREVIADDSNLTTLPIHKLLVWASMNLIETYAINSTDAIVLRSALDFATSLRNVGDELVLVASDQRLLRAARAEGLLCFNPETDSQQTLAAWLVTP